MSAPTKPTETEYSRKLAERDRRLANWMGLDPGLVFSIEDSEPDPATHGSVVVTWRTLDKPLPSPRGHAHRPAAAGAGDGETTQVTNAATLDWDDAAEMLTAVGPKPQLLTAEERAALERLR